MGRRSDKDFSSPVLGFLPRGGGFGTFNGIMKPFLPHALLLAAALAFAFPSGASATCSYCGSSGYGSCPYAKFHKHTDAGADKCMFCGSSSYGSCSLSPHGKHEHGFGHGKCRFCGSSSFGSCSYSPGGHHEH